MVNWPVASELTDAPEGVRVTFAPWRAAPCESTTDPVSVPRPVCAYAGRARGVRRLTIARRTRLIDMKLLDAA